MRVGGTRYRLSGILENSLLHFLFTLSYFMSNGFTFVLRCYFMLQRLLIIANSGSVPFPLVRIIAGYAVSIVEIRIAMHHLRSIYLLMLHQGYFIFTKN